MKEKLLKALKWFLDSYIWLFVILLALDIVTKNIIVYYGAQLTNQPVVLIPGFLRISYTINQNVAFGMSLGSPLANRIVFSIVALLVSAGIIVYMVLKWGKLRKLYRAIMMMILVGAIGNVIDRIFYTAEYLNAGGAQGVVDWIDFYGVWKFNFNIADSAVVIAAFMMIITMIVLEVKDYKERKAKEAKLEKPVKEEKKEEKILSKTEQEKQKLLEDDRAK